MSTNKWIVVAVLAFVILNWIIWKIRKAMKKEPPSGEINYTQMFRTAYCTKCGSALTVHGCYTCWKEYGA